MNTNDSFTGKICTVLVVVAKTYWVLKKKMGERMKSFSKKELKLP